MTPKTTATGLLRAFEMEAGLLNAFSDALGRQRHAIALGNSEAFDEWTEGIRRMTGELTRVEAHRRGLLEAATGTPQPSGEEVESSLEGRTRSAFVSARRGLAAAARRAARELEVNRTVLSRAIATREMRIRSLHPDVSRDPAGYGAAPSAGASPVLFSRMA